MDILESLEEIMVDGSLKIFVQPQLELSSGRIVRQEALLRFPPKLFWENGPKSTIAWIREIQKHQGLRHLTDWILDKVAEYLKKHLSYYPVSVNVPPTMIDDPFVESVIRCFHRHNVRLSRLGLEITEDFEPKSFHDLNESLKRLRSLGVHVALDDFGSGYSTMKHLMYLTLDAVKLDQAFIKNASTAAGGIVMGTLVDVVRDLSLKVICEGIETQEHLDLARAFRSDFVQGFLIGRPSPLV